VLAEAFELSQASKLRLWPAARETKRGWSDHATRAGGEFELLKSHLEEGTLAHRLVTKYGETDGNRVESALDGILAVRLEEVRNAISDAAHKLD
jgi:hypothetical protein